MSWARSLGQDADSDLALLYLHHTSSLMYCFQNLHQLWVVRAQHSI